MEIEEIVVVEEMIAFNLRIVPAVAVNGKVVYQQNGKNVEGKDLTTLIIPHL